MNREALQTICQAFEAAGVEYKLIEHEACRTSAESAAARTRAGFPKAVGAKALLTKMTFDDGTSEFNVLVLPGPTRLNSQELKAQVPRLRKFRFASSEELLDLCGVTPGEMPPFASAVFRGTSKLFVDENIGIVEFVGFNAADLEHSIVVKAQDYLRVANPTAILKFADRPEGGSVNSGPLTL
jgi:prolyl-tRNA editing enzyme YbaK/EbsC (Cys-tRNA(Pro) deacylase)